MNIDLGEKMEGGGEPMMPAKDHTMYPTLHLMTKEKIDFPKEGRAVIVFKKVSSSEKEGDGKPSRYECTLEVHKLISVDEKKNDEATTAKNFKESEDALDRLAAEKSESKKKNSENEDY